MLQVKILTRNGDGSEENLYPADYIGPPEFAAKLKKVCNEEEKREGETTHRRLCHPLVKTTRGNFPVAVLLVFVRHDNHWVKTVGHWFLLTPVWYAKLPACCQKVVKSFATLLLGETA